jgi:hypothetical protein
MVSQPFRHTKSLLSNQFKYLKMIFFLTGIDIEKIPFMPHYFCQI